MRCQVAWRCPARVQLVVIKKNGRRLWPLRQARLRLMTHGLEEFACTLVQTLIRPVAAHQLRSNPDRLLGPARREPWGDSDVIRSP